MHVYIHRPMLANISEFIKTGLDSLASEHTPHLQKPGGELMKTRTHSDLGSGRSLDYKNKMLVNKA